MSNLCHFDFLVLCIMCHVSIYVGLLCIICIFAQNTERVTETRTNFLRQLLKTRQLTPNVERVPKTRHHVFNFAFGLRKRYLIPKAMPLPVRAPQRRLIFPVARFKHVYMLSVFKTACGKPIQKSATNNFKKQQCCFETFNNF